MRAIWSGAISFSLVSIPVQLYTAIKPEQLKFHWLHKPDHGKIQYVKYCSLEQKPVPSEEIVRAYAYQKGNYVEITDEELAAVDPKASATIEIQEFVEQTQIDPIYFAKPYYVLPDAGGEKAYRLLADTLKRTNHVAVASIVLKHKPHLAALRPFNKLLVLDLMRYEEEIIKPEALPQPVEVTLNPQEQELAQALTTKMQSSFQPGKYKNLYREKLKKLIEQKIAGQKIVKPPPVRLAPVVDLVSALKQSLEEKKAA